MKRKHYKKILPFLQLLENLSREDRSIVIQFANHEALEAIIDCSVHCIKDPNDAIPENIKRAIKSHLIKDKAKWRYVCKSGNNFQKKRKIIEQRGGGPIGQIWPEGLAGYF